jgi:activating signal cointegrator 1
MKIITIQQPWAAFIAKGIKRYETRSWRTDYRGLIAIHAAKESQMKLGECVELYRQIRELGSDPGDSLKFDYGKIVAIAEVRFIYPIQGHLSVPPIEKLVGNWEHGRYAWKLKNIVALPEPMTFKGRQGLTELPVEIESICKEAICFTP